MRVLLDQGLPRSAAELLRQRGRDAIHVGELGMSQASDEEIIEHARVHGFSIVTLDADFHSLLAYAQASRPPVVRLRFQHLKAKDVADVLDKVLDRAGHELSSGCFMTVTPTTIRVRRLPFHSLDA